MKLYTADCRNNEKNCLYPHEIDITDAQSLREAVRHDYVAVEYRNGYRSKDNFVRTDCLVLDCDNEHSEDPADWVTPEAVIRHFPDTTVAFHMSRNHMKEKHGKAPRPRFHCFFLIGETPVPEVYSSLKRRMNEIFPFFDAHAMDAARFFYGTEEPEVLYHQGTITLNTCLDLYYPDQDDFAKLPQGMIPEGSRNATLSHFAGRLLKRLGEGDEAYQIFLERAASCSPPLEESELSVIWNSAVKFFRKISASSDYIRPEAFNQPVSCWDDPLPFNEKNILPFPLEALPPDIAEYVKAVAESTQTPLDMAGTIALAMISVCIHHKYVVQAKDDWLEPLNIYTLITAQPSERKSAVLNALTRPIRSYQKQYNLEHAAEVESSRMKKRSLERRQKVLEEQFAQGKVTEEAVDKIAKEVTSYQVSEPLDLLVDDVTPEKLVSILAANHGHTSMISSEAGIFDTLAGTYAKIVNIDPLLKAYSGDSIRVDRIGRESQAVDDPTLTILLMAQPVVISAVMSNPTFRGRGLTARFLYCLPDSLLGRRDVESKSPSSDLYRAYQQKIVNMLQDEYPENPEIIKLTPDAKQIMKDFAREIEGKLVREFADIAEWAGKQLGNTVRIAGLLCRAGTNRRHDFLDVNEPLVIDANTMTRAIQLERYYITHAQSAFGTLPTSSIESRAKMILEMIAKKNLKEIDRRNIMRYCRSFKTAAEVQPVLDFLEDYGYLVPKDPGISRVGRPQNPRYLVNPKALCHVCPASV